MKFDIASEEAWEAAPPRKTERGRAPELEEALDALAAGQIVRLRYASAGERRSLICSLGWGAKRRGLSLEWREGADGWLLYRALGPHPEARANAASR